MNLDLVNKKLGGPFRATILQKKHKIPILQKTSTTFFSIGVLYVLRLGNTLWNKFRFLAI